MNETCLNCTLTENSTWLVFVEDSRKSTRADIPAELIEIRWVPLTIYVILFLVGAPANLIWLYYLIRNRRGLSRFYKLLVHLVVADLSVTLITIPTEIGWRITNIWEAGNVACKVIQVFRAFGPYLSSFILVVISIDRWYVVARPLDSIRERSRNRVHLFISWILSILLSLPQVRVKFHVFR